MKRAEALSRLPQVQGLSEAEAAAFVGVSATFFRQLVMDGRMPRPRMLGTRRLWDIDEVRAAFKSAPVDEPATEDTFADF